MHILARNEGTKYSKFASKRSRLLARPFSFFLATKVLTTVRSGNTRGIWRLRSKVQTGERLMQNLVPALRGLPRASSGGDGS